VKRKQHRGSRPGRPKGPKLVGVLVRMLPEQKRDLGLLREILEGKPPVNGLIQEAVRRYIAHKLEDMHVREEFERRIQPSLKVVVSPRARSAETK